jgi:hypothetical protein
MLHCSSLRTGDLRLVTRFARPEWRPTRVACAPPRALAENSRPDPCNDDFLVAENLVLRADRQLGAAVSRAVRAHHRRRLARVGWLRALKGSAGGWAGGNPQPRPGCEIEVLIDGAEALPRIVSQLEQAKSHVHIAGWYFSPEFALTREGEAAILGHLLAELAERGGGSVTPFGSRAPR